MAGRAASSFQAARWAEKNAQTTTICPLVSNKDRRQATEWVRDAIIAGQYRFFQADKQFPKKIWFEADGQIWCGYCINSEIGEYKG